MLLFIVLLFSNSMWNEVENEDFTWILPDADWCVWCFLPPAEVQAVRGFTLMMGWHHPQHSVAAFVIILCGRRQQFLFLSLIITS